MTTSRQTIASKNRSTRAYERSVAPHVARETVEIDSAEQVLELSGSYWVASKFQGRYYRVTRDERGQWATSTRDERVAVALVERVKLYLIQTAHAA